MMLLLYASSKYVLKSMLIKKTKEEATSGQGVSKTRTRRHQARCQNPNKRAGKWAKQGQWCADKRSCQRAKQCAVSFG